MNATQPAVPGFGVVVTQLPGPGRKRLPHFYQYRITYRNPHEGETGCLMTWDVSGGSDGYQVALERTDAGSHRWHCTCADAVYRGGLRPGHLCKHVRGLIACSPPAGDMPPDQRR